MQHLGLCLTVDSPPPQFHPPCSARTPPLPAPSIQTQKNKKPWKKQKKKKCWLSKKEPWRWWSKEPCGGEWWHWGGEWWVWDFEGRERSWWDARVVSSRESSDWHDYRPWWPQCLLRPTVSVPASACHVSCTEETWRTRQRVLSTHSTQHSLPRPASFSFHLPLIAKPVPTPSRS